MPRIGTGVRASLPAAVRFERNGWRLQKLSSGKALACELPHKPVHASWLNQVEIYFSIIQRKVLTPNAFTNLAEVEVRLRLYEELSNQTPRPFAWQFTREKLTEFLQRLEAHRALVECSPTVSAS